MKKKVPISYTNRDFNSIKSALITYAKKYYPDVYKDLNEASFGSLMLDLVAYTGDILSFYTDYSANESFLDTALEYGNVLKHARDRGYKFRGNPSSFGTAIFYIVVPAAAAGLGPDSSYLPLLLKGSEFGTTSGNIFILNENVDFSLASNEVVVAQINTANGLPTSYAIKAMGQVISGELVREQITVGDFEKFRKIRLGDDNLAEVVSVFDSEGHEYFEVDFLSQNIIFKDVVNRGSDANMAPSILKPVIVARRFIVDRREDDTFLQFGYGTSEELTSNAVADPSSVVLRLHGKDYESDEAFDPAKLLTTDKFGVAPANTVLTIISRKNTSEIVNAAVDTLTEAINPIFEFPSQASLSAGTISDIAESLEVTNDDPITGDVTLPTTEELKIRIKDSFATQNRAVTDQDYMSMVYRMPPKFGAIKRCSVMRDPDSFKRNLNLYVISENTDGTLTAATDTIKKNLRRWISMNKMINDTIDILDAKIVNIGIKFEIIAVDETDKYSALNDSAFALREVFVKHFDIGETFSITDVYSALKAVDSVLDVTSVEIVSNNGGIYSDTRFDLEMNTSPRGRMIYCPRNCIFEVKYPLSDIVGTVK